MGGRLGLRHFFVTDGQKRDYSVREARLKTAMFMAAERIKHGHFCRINFHRPTARRNTTVMKRRRGRITDAGDVV